MGNHDRNHWKSGNQASHRNPCEILNKYKIHERNLKYIYKYHLISLIMISADFWMCTVFCKVFCFETKTAVYKDKLYSAKVCY